MKKFGSIILFYCAFHINAYAQKNVIITTRSNALIFEVDSDHSLRQVYYGKKLTGDTEYSHIQTLDKVVPGSDDVYNKREAYVASGGINLLEPALSITHADGDKSTALTFLRSEVTEIDANSKQTTIFLKDEVHPLQVRLHYIARIKEDVIEQWAEIVHQEQKNIVLNKYASANITLSGHKFFLKSHHSGWGTEMRSEEQQLRHNLVTLDSKLNTRANLLHSSSFMVSLDRPATETTGDVMAGTLAYTGNFRIDFENFDEYYLRITAGINNFASNYTLRKNEVFITPRFIHTLSDAGRGQASRNLHNWARNYQLAQGKGERLTLLNNWETTYFDFNDKKLRELIADTKNLGVDLFLLDDGWFGNKYPRNNSGAGLGDWQYNRQKLKEGIGSLGREATAGGVKFGIWLEPEMVNPKSELYEQHPDWIVRNRGRKEFYMRNQLVLDLSNPAVQDFVFNVVDKTFKEVPELAFIKWDCNAITNNPQSATIKNQDHFYIEYVRGLFNVLKRVKEKYPQVPMMLCAGGGSRVDYGALQYFTEFWPSDNTNPLDRIFIQWEYSYYFPSISVDNHVTDMGRQPIKFKTDVAMMGKLGYDIRVNELKPEELTFSQQAIRTYEGIKDIIWHGDQYRLQNPYENNIAALAYVDGAKSKAVIFNYWVSSTLQPNTAIPIKMQGLDPQKQYTIEEVNLFPGTKSPINPSKSYSGEFLMKVGYNPEASSRRTSVVLVLNARR